MDGRYGDVHDLDLVLRIEGCFRGTVRWPDGAPVSDGWIAAKQVTKSKGATFHDGTFELCGLQDEDWGLELSATREGEFGRFAQELRPDQGQLNLVLETAPRFDVQITVVGPRGTPVDFRVGAHFSANVQATARGRGTGILEGVHADGDRGPTRRIGGPDLRPDFGE